MYLLREQSGHQEPVAAVRDTKMPTGPRAETQLPLERFRYRRQLPRCRPQRRCGLKARTSYRAAKARIVEMSISQPTPAMKPQTMQVIIPSNALLCQRCASNATRPPTIADDSQAKIFQACPRINDPKAPQSATLHACREDMITAALDKKTAPAGERRSR